MQMSKNVNNDVSMNPLLSKQEEPSLYRSTGNYFSHVLRSVRFSHLGSLFYVELVPRDLFPYLVLYTRLRVNVEH